MQNNTEEILLNSAKKLFIKQGYKSTKVNEITKKSNIGTGTFYNYFDSKSDIFLEIYLNRHNKMLNKMTSLINNDDEPIDIVENVLKTFLDIMKTDPILKMFLDREIHHKFRESYEILRKKNRFENTYNIFRPYYIKWQEQNKINKSVDLKTLLATFDSLFYIELYKKDIGNEFFPDVLDFLIESILLKLRKNN
ncbi:MAG: TetR/AcrR family transcriptional regulator [Bacillota bacterium]